MVVLIVRHPVQRCQAHILLHYVGIGTIVEQKLHAKFPGDFWIVQAFQPDALRPKEALKTTAVDGRTPIPIQIIDVIFEGLRESFLHPLEGLDGSVESCLVDWTHLVFIFDTEEVLPLFFSQLVICHLQINVKLLVIVPNAADKKLPLHLFVHFCLFLKTTQLWHLLVLCRVVLFLAV